MLPARRVIMQGAARAALKQQRGALQKIIPTTSSAATSSINNKTQCRYFSQQKSLFDDATATKTKTTTQKTETTQDDFTPQSIEDHKVMNTTILYIVL